MPNRFLILAALLVPSLSAAAERTVTLAVENMTCALCPITVKRAISAVPGVASVEVDMDTHSAVVTFDDAATSPERLAEASTNAGFPAHPAE